MFIDKSSLTHSFLASFTSVMPLWVCKSLFVFNTGLEIKPECEIIPVTVKAAVILGSTDLQGKAYLTCMTQHNGESGCITCEEPGHIVKQGKGHTRCYPYRNLPEAAPKRTHESFLRNGLSAHRENKKVGFFGNEMLHVYALCYY